MCHTLTRSKCPHLCVCICRVTSHLDLLLRPLVQIHRLDLGDVDPQVSMDTGTADTDEDAQVP